MSNDKKEAFGRAEEFLALFSRGAEFTKQLLQENERLRGRLNGLEDRQNYAAQDNQEWDKLREELLARIEAVAGGDVGEVQPHQRVVAPRAGEGDVTRHRQGDDGQAQEVLVLAEQAYASGSGNGNFIDRIGLVHCFGLYINIVLCCRVRIFIPELAIMCPMGILWLIIYLLSLLAAVGAVEGLTGGRIGAHKWLMTLPLYPDSPYIALFRKARLS